MTISNIPPSWPYALKIDEVKEEYQKNGSTVDLVPYGRTCSKGRWIDFAPGPRSISKEGNSMEHGYHGNVKRGFIGSYETISVETTDAQTYVRGSCIAAPRVSLLAENLFLGIREHDYYLWSCGPMEIYAPEYLNIETDCLTVDRVSLLEEPKEGIISCNRLILITDKNDSEDPKCFEIFKSLIPDNATVERDGFYPGRGLCYYYDTYVRMMERSNAEAQKRQIVSSVYLGES